MGKLPFIKWKQNWSIIIELKNVMYLEETKHCMKALFTRAVVLIAEKEELVEKEEKKSQGESILSF